MRKADNLPPNYAAVTKSGNLNFLEPSGPLQACNGTGFTLYIILIYNTILKVKVKIALEHRPKRGVEV